MQERFVICLLALAMISANANIHAEDWPQWRGTGRDGLSQEKGLLKEWPEDGPRVEWINPNVGAAYSSLAIVDGRIYTLGNTDEKSEVYCLDEKTGEPIWVLPLPGEDKAYKHGRGDGARGTPTFHDGKLYVESGGGAVACLDAKTGKTIWTKHLVQDFGGRVPGWGYSESPLIDGNQLIVTPGGQQGAIIALDKNTGNAIWSSEDVKDRAHYSSAIAMDFGGVHQIVQFTNSRLVGLDASNGKLLWDYANSANKTANVCTPIFADGYVFSSSAYGTGGGLVQLVKQGDAFEAREIYFNKSMANHHGGIVLYDGYMYGFGSGGLICMNFKTGEIAWRNRSVSKGSLCLVNGYLYCLGERNQMALVKADPKEYTELGRFSLDKSGFPTWAHPVVANGRLYLRDQNMLTSYNIATK